MLKDVIKLFCIGVYSCCVCNGQTDATLCGWLINWGHFSLLKSFLGSHSKSKRKFLKLLKFLKYEPVVNSNKNFLSRTKICLSSSNFVVNARPTNLSIKSDTKLFPIYTYSYLLVLPKKKMRIYTKWIIYLLTAMCLTLYVTLMTNPVKSLNSG